MITKDQLSIWHEEYVTSISDRGWAVSIQTSMLLFDKISERGRIKVVDFGSGFSSAVIRSFTQNSSYSVDHDKAWLEKTKAFLISKGLDTTGLMHLDEFMASGITDLDLAFYDLGNSKSVRWDNFLPCYERMKEGGIIILDDLHCKAGYIEFIRSSIRKTSQVTVMPQTTDGFGRFSGILLV